MNRSSEQGAFSYLCLTNAYRLRKPTISVTNISCGVRTTAVRIPSEQHSDMHTALADIIMIMTLLSGYAILFWHWTTSCVVFRVFPKLSYVDITISGFLGAFVELDMHKFVYEIKNGIRFFLVIVGVRNRLYESLWLILHRIDTQQTQNTCIIFIQTLDQRLRRWAGVI